MFTPHPAPEFVPLKGLSAAFGPHPSSDLPKEIKPKEEISSSPIHLHWNTYWEYESNFNLNMKSLSLKTDTDR